LFSPFFKESLNTDKHHHFLVKLSMAGRRITADTGVTENRILDKPLFHAYIVCWSPMSRPQPTLLLLVLVICLSVLHPALSQPNNLTFEHISTPEGLSQDIVRAIVQDHDGFMWFGTEDGLNRYDGYSMKIYKHSTHDSTTVSLNGSSDIYEDSRGRLWVGTGNGLNLFDRDRDRFIRFYSNPADQGTLSSSVISVVREDRRSRLWIGTANGLNRYDEDKQKFVRYFHDPHDSASMNADGVISLLLDRKGALWVTTTNGICRYDETTDRFTRYLCKTRTSLQRTILQLYEDRTGNLWAIWADRGVWSFDPANNTFEPLPLRSSSTRPATAHELGAVVVSSIAEDRGGNLWIGHFNGLDVFDPKTRTFAHYSHDPADPSSVTERVITVYRDRVGVMWLGTFQGGVARCDPNRQKFQSYRKTSNPESGLSSNYVTAVCEDKGDYVWIGTDDGLDRFDPRTHTFTHYHHDPRDEHSVCADQISALFEDRRENLWIGAGEGTRSGLDCLDRERKRFVHHPIPSVKCILEDSRGNLWVGKINETDTGEDVVRLNRNREVVSRDTIAGTGVWCLYEDRHGSIWLGGQYCCLNRFDRVTHRFTHFEFSLTNPAGPSSGAVRSVFEDDSGYFWFGTWGGGVDRYDPRTSTYVYFMAQDGLPSDYVKGILSDDHGNLWIATEKGLSRFNRTTHVFKNFTTEDGLQGDRFLSNSCFKGKDGWMYFGGTNGLNRFHPDSIRDNRNIPPVVITSFKIFDKQVLLPRSLSAPDAMHLTYDQDFISFEFVALDYTAPLRNQYAYKLDGFDQDWIQAGTRRYAAYTRLGPGEYVFRVRGSNSDGVWNDEGVSIRLIIAPPFWRTWWFAILALLAIATFLYLLYRYRVNQLLDIERLRARIASDLHDDVGTDLSSIVLATQSMERKLPLSPEGRDDVRQIGTIALRTQDMMRDIVWVLNSRNDSLSDMVLRMREVAARMLIHISYSFKGPEAPVTEKTSLEFKRNVFLFYKECLNNVVRHSDASLVGIEIDVRQKEFLLKISDNGKGFDPDMLNAGIGLRSLRSRAQILGANLSISSRPGGGTEISLTVKTPQMRHST
jgi:ligand-binding sensor domain-containing protein